MLFCLLFIHPQQMHYPLSSLVFAAVRDYFFQSKRAITIAAAVASTRLTGCQEFPRPSHDLRSQDPEPSAAHAHVRVLVFFEVSLKEMTNPKAALESKVTVATKSIQPIGRPEQHEHFHT